MEVRYLKVAAESGLKPKRVDIKALWSQYGDDIIFALLHGNLRVLTAVRDVLEGLELSDLEDTDGTETYHPDLRRLGDILMRKTYFKLSEAQTEINVSCFL